MALSYRARRRWALVILLVGLPLYVIVAVNLVALFERPSVLVELAVTLVQAVMALQEVILYLIQLYLLAVEHLA